MIWQKSLLVNNFRDYFTIGHEEARGQRSQGKSEGVKEFSKSTVNCQPSIVR